MNTNHKGNSDTHPIKAIILLGMLSFGSVQLKTNDLLGPGGLASLLIASGIFSLAIYFGERTKKVRPSSIELYEAVQQVKDAETSVKELSLALLDVLDAKDHGIMLESYDRQAYEQAVEKVKNLAL